MSLELPGRPWRLCGCTSAWHSGCAYDRTPRHDAERDGVHVRTMRRSRTHRHRRCASPRIAAVGTTESSWPEPRPDPEDVLEALQIPQYRVIDTGFAVAHVGHPRCRQALCCRRQVSSIVALRHDSCRAVYYVLSSIVARGTIPHGNWMPLLRRQTSTCKAKTKVSPWCRQSTSTGLTEVHPHRQPE